MTEIGKHILEAETKALDSLARYKFVMFGYWAGVWVHLNQIEGKKRPSPFKDLVHKARDMQPPKFKIAKDEPWKIYEDTGDPKKDRLVMYATPSGAMLEGPGLGNETAQLYEAVPEDMIEKALEHWKED